MVVDDDAQGVEEVVRADDLLSSTPRHAHLADMLGIPGRHGPTFLWFSPPMVILAKRHGAVTLDDRLAVGDTRVG